MAGESRTIVGHGRRRPAARARFRVWRMPPATSSSSFSRRAKASAMRALTICFA